MKISMFTGSCQERRQRPLPECPTHWNENSALPPGFLLTPGQGSLMPPLSPSHPQKGQPRAGALQWLFPPCLRLLLYPQVMGGAGRYCSNWNKNHLRCMSKFTQDSESAKSYILKGTLWMPFCKGGRKGEYQVIKLPFSHSFFSVILYFEWVIGCVRLSEHSQANLLQWHLKFVKMICTIKWF